MLTKTSRFGLALATLVVLVVSLSGPAKADPPPPTNDDRAAAATLAVNAPIQTTNLGATLQSGEASGCGGHASLWYSFTASAADEYLFVLHPDEVDLALSVFDPSASTPAQCADTGYGGRTEQLAVPLAASQQILVRVAGFRATDVGEFGLIARQGSRTPSTTMIASSADPALIGEPVTYTATVAPESATGTVRFGNAGPENPIAGCDARPLTDGVATCTTTWTATGTHTVHATYSGDFDRMISSTSLTQQVEGSQGTQPSTVTMTATPNPAPLNSTVTLSAAVSPSTATGVVTFRVGSRELGGCLDRPISNGAASCTTVANAAGTFGLTAAYSGDADFAGSISPAVTLLIEGGSGIRTGTAIGSSPNPSTPGQAVTLTATVTPADAGGSVTFYRGSDAIGGCNTRELIAGVATCSTMFAELGSIELHAQYNSSPSHTISISAAMTQVVQPTQQPTTTTLTLTPNPSLVGENVTLTATVSPSAATGTVAFHLNGGSIGGCDAQPLNSGTATCTTTFATAGSFELSAGYSGSTTHAASTSQSVSQIVRHATVMALESSMNPSIVGQSVTFTATVSPGDATGTVRFTDGGSAIGGCNSAPVAGGTATCTTSLDDAGGHVIVAAYSGDVRHAASESGPLLQHVIAQAPTTSSLAGPTNGPVVGQAATFNLHLMPASASGTVAFIDNGSPVFGCQARTVTSGEASCTITWNSVGLHTLTATYSGDSSHAGSTSNAVAVYVGQAPTSLSAVAPRYIGFTVTVQAQLLNTATNAPIAGQVIHFRAGNTVLCSAVTGSTGQAKCTAGYGGWLAVVSRGTYTSEFPGTANYVGSSDSA